MRFIAWILWKLFGNVGGQKGLVTKRDSKKEVEKFEKRRLE